MSGKRLCGAFVAADTYASLQDLAKRENRTVADQCRSIYDKALSGELVVAPFVGAPRRKSPFEKFERDLKHDPEMEKLREIARSEEVPIQRIAKRAVERNLG